MGLFKSKEERQREKMLKREESLLGVAQEQRDYLEQIAQGGGAGAVAGTQAVGGVRHAAHKSVLALHSHNTFLFVIICFAVNLFHVWRNSISFPGDIFVMSLYVFLAFLAAFVFYADQHENPLRRFGMFLALSALAYFVPFLIMFLKDKGIIHVPLATFLMLFAPVWLFYILVLNPGDDDATRKVAFIFILGWILYLTANGLLELGSGTQTQVMLLSPGEAREALAIIITKIRGAAGVVTSPVDSTKKAYNDTKNFFSGQLAGATQEYYTGTVDQSQGAPIGVFISDGQPILTKFYSDADDVVVTATVKSRTFSDHLTIKNRCELEVFDTTNISQAGYVRVKGDVDPDKIEIDATREFQERTAIDCTVPREKTDYEGGISSEGYSSRINTARVTTTTLYFNSTFDFETWGYAEYGFMDRQLIQAFRTENQDPAQILKMSPTLRAKYTPGPLMVGMPSDSQPVSYDSTVKAEDRRVPAFGVTLSNAWMGKGQVDRFEYVDFIIPKPFEIEEDECTPKPGTNLIKDDSNRLLKYTSEGAWTKNLAYNRYRITNVAVRPGDTFITIRCPMKISGEEKQYPVLGSSGAGKFTFFVHTNYTYSTWTRVPVNIQGVAN